MRTAVIVLSALALTMTSEIGHLAAQTVPQLQSETRLFNIPAQPLRRALFEFNRQAGVQLSEASGTLPADITAKAVVGRFTPQDALSRLLDGTGIVHDFISSDTAIISAPGQQATGEGLDGGSTTLTPIVITGKTGRNAATASGFQGTPDWVYETPASVSVVGRDAIQNLSARNARELLANTAGVNVSGDTTQNQGINVNLRGLQDQNRVTTMIDGARQNFQRSGHGSTGYTYVDPALIRAVEVEKSGTSGVGGAGTLAGSVDFTTLVADDLIRDGNKIGVELDATTGTNEYHFAGSAAVAIRPTDSFSILGAISGKNLGLYDIGENGTPGSGWDLLGVDRPIFTGSDTTSRLLKVETLPTEDITFDLSWLHYQSQFSQGANETTAGGGLREDTQDITNDTFVAAFGWDPESELIDLKARLSFNAVDNDEERARRTASVDQVDTDYSMETFGASLENTSRFSLPAGELALNYGAEFYRDHGDTTVSGPAVDTDPNTALWYGGANPSGSRDVASAFANATLDHDEWLTVSGGLRYDYYKVFGTSTVFLTPYTETVTRPITIPGSCSPIPAAVLGYRDSGDPRWTLYVNAQARIGNRIVGNTLCRPDRHETISEQVIRFPTQDIDVDLSDSALLPTAMVAVKPLDNVQLFAKYSETFRPPTIMEAVTGGTHVGAFGPGNAPNPTLTAEDGQTYEIGLNYTQDDLFIGGDSFRTKAVAFYRDIENYIALGTIDLSSGAGTTQYASYVNLDGKTRMRGVEVEGNYDAGRFYLGGSYTLLDADYADTYTYRGISYPTGQYVIFTAPRRKVTLDGGFRLLDEKLTLGARLSHVEVEKQDVGTVPSLLASYASEDYTILDLYGSYRLNDTATLRFAVNNVADVAYLPALGTGTLPAPGRTATVSLNMRF